MSTLISQFLRLSVIEISGPHEEVYPLKTATPLQHSLALGRYYAGQIAYLVSLIVYANESEPCGQPLPPYDMLLKSLPMMLEPAMIWARIGKASICIVASRMSLLLEDGNMIIRVCDVVAKTLENE
jgi:hypothetical protein